jgi:hypothetical protein
MTERIGELNELRDFRIKAQNKGINIYSIYIVSSDRFLNLYLQ